MDIRRNLSLLHLSVLVGSILPLGSIFGPLLVNRIIGKENIEMKKTTSNIVNFQIVWTFIVISSLFIFWYRQIINFSKGEGLQINNFIWVIVVGALIFNFFYPILISIIVTVSKKVKMFYPSIIRFIK